MAPKAAPTSFNEIHSAFVTTEDGTSLAELLQVLGCISLTPILVPLITPWVVPPSFVQHAVSNKDFFFLIRGILEYPIIMVLPVWIVTVFPGEEVSTGWIQTSGAVLLTLLCIILGILIVNHSITAPKWFGLFQHWEKLKNMPTGWSNGRSNQATSTTSGTSSPAIGRFPFVTNYRAIVIYITILCILAVDFFIFPRRFAKTKDYGISLMDVGTGCFIFANGIVAPEARNKRSPLLKSLKSTIPIILLGFIRLISVKGIEYQEVVEEYEVHWNFFFTLAGVKLFSSFFFILCDSSHGLKLAAVVSLLYEFLLQQNDYQNAFILNPQVPRSRSLFHANPEGIFVVVTWCGILPCRRTAYLGYVLLMTALNYSLLWGQIFTTLLQVCLQHHGIIYGPILFYEMRALQQKSSKRIQNLQNMSKEFSKINAEAQEDCLDEQMRHLEDQLKNAYEEVKKLKVNNTSKSAQVGEINQLERRLLENTSDPENEDNKEEEKNNLVLMPDLSKSPVILEAICYNGLAVFLLGNLLTGLINCAIYTTYTPAYLSLCYLWFYVTLLTAFSITLYWFETQLKFW